MNSSKTWLWLEDAPTTVSDIAQLLSMNDIKTKKISNPSDLIIFLLNERGKGLENYGLLIDVMIQGAHFISSPQAWNGGADAIYRTETGYDAGIVFVEEIVLNKNGNWKPIWKNPLPPIIFITTLTESDEQAQRILNIKQAWAENMKVTESESKIAWWRKWDLNTDKYIKLMKTW